MKTIPFGARGEEAQVFIRRGDSNQGASVCILVAENDDTYTMTASYFADPQMARAAYDSLLSGDVAERIVIKRAGGSADEFDGVRKEDPA